jgi:plastocyanin
LVLLGLAATAGLGVLPVASAAAVTTDASIRNFSFSPDPLTIPVGGSVTWTNDDNATHTVTADDGSFDSGGTSLHGTFTRTFDTAGSFAYHCNVHRSMHGTVQVAATTTTTVAPTTTTTAAAPTTTTTVRATTTTTVSAPTTQPAAGAGGAGPSPTTVAAEPKPAAPKPAAPSTTRATAAPATAAPATATSPPAPTAAPTTAPTAAGAATGDITGPAGTTPSSEVASGVTTPGNGDGGGRGGAGPLMAAAVAVALLGAGGFGAARYRRRS